MDVDSNSGLAVEWPPERIPKQSAGTEEAVQVAIANPSATPVSKDVPTPMEVQGEEEMETGEVAKVSRPTLEELAMAVACPATPTPMPTTACSLRSSPIQIYSMELCVPQVPLFPFANSDNH